MFNPISYIRDVIDLVRNPPGKAVFAMEITNDNKQIVRDNYDIPEKYIRTGDFLLEFENTVTICPKKEFHKHYAFDGPVHTNAMTLVRTTKPL